MLPLLIHVPKTMMTPGMGRLEDQGNWLQLLQNTMIMIMTT